MAKDSNFFFDEDEDFERRRAEARRKDELRRKKKILYRYRALLCAAAGGLLLIGIVIAVIAGINKSKGDKELVAEDSQQMTETVAQNAPMVDSTQITVQPPDETEDTDLAADETDATIEENSESSSEEVHSGWPLTERIDRSNEEVKVYSAQADQSTTGFPENVASVYGLLIDMENGKILSQRDPKAKMFPASMTKIMTCLIAAEYVDNLDDTFVMTPEINYYSYKHDCSAAGFKDEEVVTVRDLFYGTMLPSGGEAAVALATYVAGSHEAFVDLMNDRLEKMGLSETTHFTNCVGIYNDDHYSTCYDMAMIMEAAMENELCREVMHTHVFTTSSTEQHPDGIGLSNWFLRKIEDHVSGGEVYAAKTGYVNESGFCSSSYGVADDGHRYICVTGSSTSSWKCIKDHVAIYDTVFKTGEADAEAEDVAESGN